MIAIERVSTLPEDLGQDASHRRASIIHIATFDAIAVGYITAETDAESVRVIGHWVDPAFRNLGIGELLLEALVDVAIISGASELNAAVPTGDRIAKLTYEAMGFKAHHILVRRKL
ncbi:MAG: GNAT family N-acetyltransferase [Ferrimicrobium sp.]